MLCTTCTSYITKHLQKAPEELKTVSAAQSKCNGFLNLFLVVNLLYPLKLLNRQVEYVIMVLNCLFVILIVFIMKEFQNIAVYLTLSYQKKKNNTRNGFTFYFVKKKFEMGCWNTASINAISNSYIKNGHPTDPPDNFIES